jgi:hypothetical protein
MGYPDVALLRIDKGADVDKHDHIGSNWAWRGCSSRLMQMSLPNIP